MEEILASIRRIISEDGDEAEGGDKPAGADDEDDVLELTEVVPDEPQAAAEEPEEEPAIVEEPVAEEPAIVADDDSEAIISEAPAAQAAGSIADLMARVQSDTRLGDADKTIEQIVKELLRPLLKEWLDANLPDMVERIVRDEIERVVAKSK